MSYFNSCACICVCMYCMIRPEWAITCLFTQIPASSKLAENPPQYYLELVACLCVFLGCQVVIALTHAAISYPLQELLSGLFRQVFWISYSHSLCQLLCDGQVLRHTQLQGLKVLSCTYTNEKTHTYKYVRMNWYFHVQVMSVTNGYLLGRHQ